MAVLKVQGIRVKFNNDEEASLSVADLRNGDGRLSALAAADQVGGVGRVQASGNKDGWVSEAEIARTTGLYASATMDGLKLAAEARRQHTGNRLVAAMRESHAPVVKAPPPLGIPEAQMGEQPRSAFVPLAEHLASRFAKAQSYAAAYGDPGNQIFHFKADDVVQAYSLHEIKAALAILTAREGGLEFALSRDKQGAHHLVQGQPDQVEFDEDITGFDQVFHTHPTHGSQGAFPSHGDLVMARAHDPDHRAGVVTQDGFTLDYETTERGNTLGEPARLWRRAEPGQ
jgi:hypothetical protein